VCVESGLGEVLAGNQGHPTGLRAHNRCTMVKNNRRNNKERLPTELVLFVAQSRGYVDVYFEPLVDAVSRSGASLEIALPSWLETEVKLPPQARVQYFEDFEDSERAAFAEAHRWNVLLNRKLSRSFDYRSRTVFPTWRVSLLKTAREIGLRHNKVRISISGTLGARQRIPQAYLATRLYLGWLFASFVLILGTVRAPIGRLLALLRLKSPGGRKKVEDLIAGSPRHSKLAGLIGELQPNLIVVPSLGHEIIPTDAIRASRRANLKSLLLVDNWDNLSSKSILSTLPDFMGTWGPQSSTHATEIQGMPEERVFSLGAPRFESHFSVGSKRSKMPDTREKYILYCGTSMYSREDYILNYLDQILGRNGLAIPILYRPHPQRFREPGRALKNEYGLVRIDSTSDSRFWGNLDPYRNPRGDSLSELLSGSLFAVGGLTSVLLEAELLNKRYVALAHQELWNYSSPRVVFNTYDHYRGIENLPHLTLCKKISKLEGIVLEHISDPNIPGSRVASNRARSHFLTGFSEDSYRENLSQAISTILSIAK